MKKVLFSLSLYVILFFSIMPQMAYAGTVNPWRCLQEAMHGMDVGSLEESYTDYFSVEDSDDARTITLLQDIAAIDGDTTLSLGSYKHVILDLNGKSIDGSYNTGSVFTVTVTKVLTIMDSDINNKGYITAGNSAGTKTQKNVYGGVIHVDGGTVKFESGTIKDTKINALGGHDTSFARGGAVYIESGNFSMSNDAIIENCTVAAPMQNISYNYNEGGAVYIKSGKFDMLGNSQIIGCTACVNTKSYGRGSAVAMAGGIFNMFDNAKISGCNASDSGTVRLDGGTFNMFGGAVIEECKAATGYGGAVAVCASSATFNMSENSIIRNCQSPECHGGGVYINYEGNANLSGGTITGCSAVNGGGVDAEEGCSLTLGGSIKITGNTVNDSANNLYIGLDSTINIDNPLDDMAVGVTMRTEYGQFTTNANKSDVHLFSSDNPEYKVEYDSSNAVLKLVKVHKFVYEKNSLNSAQMVVTCIDSECESGYNNNPLTLTLVAPTELEYNGAAKEVTISSEEISKWTEEDLTVPDIIYSSKTGSHLSDNKPVDAGEYSASITIDSVNVSIDFSISKVTPKIVGIPNASAITYGQTLSDSTLSNGKVSFGDWVVDGTFSWTDFQEKPQVSDSDTTEYQVIFTPKNSSYESVTCKVKLVVNKAEYSDVIRTASGEIKSRVGNTVEISLPEIASGAEYGEPVKENPDDPYSLGSISNGKILVTSEGIVGLKTMHFTVPIIPDINHVGYTIDVSIIPTQRRFKDVSENKWYGKDGGPIDYVVDKGIMSGTSEDTFSPDSACTREMFVQILYNMEGKPGAGPSNPFNDVHHEWYYDAVTWAVANGVTSGTSATSYGIGSKVTREQLAQFHLNYAKRRGFFDMTVRADISKFPDASQVSDWAKDAMSWANANGIINGKAKQGVNYLDPKGNAKRAEVAQMIMSFQKKFGK